MRFFTQRSTVALLAFSSFFLSFQAEAAKALNVGRLYAQNTADAAASPTPIPSPSPTPSPTPEAESKPRASGESKKVNEKISAELRKNCDRHFPGLIQAEVRAACSAASASHQKYGKVPAQINCRLSFGDEPRLVMACLIGVAVSEDMANKSDGYKKKLQLCAENYPAHTEIDAFLQESCLTGIHLPELLGDKPRVELCGQITPERSFLGPCGVGLSLAMDQVGNAQPSQQNKLCEHYFDHRQFHAGYRACLNARSAALSWNGRYEDALKNCTEVVADKNSDTERAACVVGVNIYNKLTKKEDVATRFQKCGDNKVSYQDRDFLACLTAASLLDLTDKNGAENGCKDIFKTAKTRGRGDCLNSLAQF